ncbi:MAG: Gfo/Idh/MocA family oxidoreductase [Kiritimatiellae bacterium]|nr:Gfo/Idh/MocA family oxidoreductase [Kiritimatiellia bacterium]
MNINASRRGFLRGLAGATAMGFAGCASSNCCCSGGKKIRLAAVGIWGKGFSDWLPMVKSGKAELVALCDADANMLAKVAGHKSVKELGLDVSKVKFYTDYRKLLDDAGALGIQAMTVSTPDHMHAPIAVSAMKMGTHVYVQKPLVRTMWELDYFRKTAKEYGVITQMGNQGSALDTMRRCTEVVQSGILGDVKEVHVWTNRPVWPQGKLAAESTLGDADPIPAGLNWDAWLGISKMRNFKGPYKPGKKGYDPWNLCTGVYHQFSWRGFFDFGCGAFGDMACHTMNMPFRGLELATVKSAECIRIEEKNDIAYPTKSIVRLIYAARPSAVQKNADGSAKTLPECVVYWYDGDVKPEAKIMPKWAEQHGGKVPNTGCYIIGSKGCVLMQDDYGGKCAIALKDDKEFVDCFQHEAAKAVPRSIQFRSDVAAGQADGPGAAAVSADGHYVEFLDAILGIGPVYRETQSRCYADVDFSVPIMEGIIAGCIAQQVPNKLVWDSAAQRFTNSPEANELLKPYIRKGYEF